MLRRNRPCSPSAWALLQSHSWDFPVVELVYLVSFPSRITQEGTSWWGVCDTGEWEEHLDPSRISADVSVEAEAPVARLHRGILSSQETRSVVCSAAGHWRCSTSVPAAAPISSTLVSRDSFSPFVAVRSRRSATQTGPELPLVREVNAHR